MVIGRSNSLHERPKRSTSYCRCNLGCHHVKHRAQKKKNNVTARTTSRDEESECSACIHNDLGVVRKSAYCVNDSCHPALANKLLYRGILGNELDQTNTRCRTASKGDLTEAEHSAVTCKALVREASKSRKGQVDAAGIHYLLPDRVVLLQ